VIEVKRAQVVDEEEEQRRFIETAADLIVHQINNTLPDRDVRSREVIRVDFRGWSEALSDDDVIREVTRRIEAAGWRLVDYELAVKDNGQREPETDERHLTLMAKLTKG
jgi:hypothetical protein